MNVTTGQQMLLCLSQYSLLESLYPGRIYYSDVKQIIQEVGINEYPHVLQAAKLNCCFCNYEWRHINSSRCPSRKDAALAINLHTYNNIILMLREIVVITLTDISLPTGSINSDGRWVCRQQSLCGQPSPFL